MNVASLDLCRELYELSGWSDTYFHWGGAHVKGGTPRTWRVTAIKGRAGTTPIKYSYPAYDLGFLLRKLPAMDEHNDFITLFHSPTGPWVMDYADDEFEADTPEDAACKLAIELFKQEVLQQQRDNHE